MLERSSCLAGDGRISCPATAASGFSFGIPPATVRARSANDFSNNRINRSVQPAILEKT